jgi:hypothetical protein
MPPSEMELLRLWEKATGRCQCQRWAHNHTYVRCNRRLTFEQRGINAEGGWVPHFRSSPVTETVLDCEILCWDCYQRVMAAEMHSLQ